MSRDKRFKDQIEDLFSDVAPPTPEAAEEQHARAEVPPVVSQALDKLISAPEQPSAPSPAPAESVWRQRLERWLAIPTDDLEMARKGNLVGRLLIAGLIAALAAIGVSTVLLLGGVSFPVLLGLGIPIGGSAVLLLSFALVKRGRVNAGIQLYAVGIFVGCLVVTSATPLSTGMALYFLWPIAVVGLLLEPLYALWTALAATGATFFIFVLQEMEEMYQPPMTLAQNQELLLNLGNWLILFITIGILMYMVTRSRMRALQQERALRTELAAQQDALAHQVAERTRLLQKANYQLQKRAIHLEASAQVSQAAVSTLDPQELMQTTVDLIRTQFNFYHVSFFLLDETGEWAVVRASTGTVGQKMVAQPHRLAVGSESMVGWVCANRQPRIALDVGADAVHFDHPWLPGTKSEITLPLSVGEKLLGALDVQSTEENAFDDDDARTLQGMADLVAVALENARLFASTWQGTRHQRLVTRLTGRVQKATSVADILQLAVKDLGETFDLAEATICLGTEAELQTDGKAKMKTRSREAE